MTTGRVGTPEAWPEKSPLREVLDSKLKLSMESQALLSAMSDLLDRQAEQLKLALQAHESQILQAVEDTRLDTKGVALSDRLTLDSLQSKIDKPAWKDSPAWRAEDPPAIVMHVPQILPAEHLPPIASPADSTVSLPGQPILEQKPMENEEPWETTSIVSGEPDDFNSDCPSEHSGAKLQRTQTVAASLDEVKDMLPEYMKETGRKSVRQARMQTRRISVDSLHYAEQHTRRIVEVIVKSRVVEGIVTAAIFINAVTIGWEADWSIKHPSQQSPLFFKIANTVFTVIFTVELVLRLFVYRASFFWLTNKEFRWNMFDTFLVISAIVDDAISIFVSAPNFTVIRVLRVFRLVRVVRVVRVLRFFQDLRFIVAGIAGAMRSMIWAVVLLFLMMYLVSVCFLQVAAFELEKMDAESQSVFLGFYGSLFLSIYTMYQSITGGLDWGDAAEPLQEMSTILALLYCFFIAFSVLCVLNIITGVFVENASHISIADEEQLVIDGFENRVRWFEEVKKLYHSMIENSDKSALDANDFHEFLDNVKVQAYFRKLGIDVHESSKNGLFQLLDFDETGLVELDEFALGLQMLHGPAKSIDLARIRCDLKRCKKDISYIAESIAEKTSGHPRGSMASFRQSEAGGSRFYGSEQPHRLSPSAIARYSSEPSRAPPMNGCKHSRLSPSWISHTPKADERAWTGELG